MKVSSFTIFFILVILLWIPVIKSTFFSDNKIKLTKRGRVVKRIAITLLVLATIGILNYLTLPAECRGSDVDKLSDFCIELRFS